MPKLVLDANALLLPFQIPLNLDTEIQGLIGEFEGLVPRCVLEELEGLQSSVPAAKAAFRLAQRYTLVEAAPPADAAILKLAVEHSAYVLSLDRDLIEKLRLVNVRVLTLRAGNRLVLLGN